MLNDHGDGLGWLGHKPTLKRNIDLDKVCQGSSECLNRRERCLEVQDETAVVNTTKLQHLQSE